MKKIGYFLLGLIFYFAVQFISIWVGTALGYGQAETRSIGRVIPVFFAIIIVCISIIVKINKKNK